FLNGGAQDEGAGPNADRGIGVFLRSRREPFYGPGAFSAGVERLPLLTVQRTGAPVGSGVCRPVFLHIQGAPRSGSGLWRAGGCPSSTRRALRLLLIESIRGENRGIVVKAGLCRVLRVGNGAGAGQLVGHDNCRLGA